MKELLFTHNWNNKLNCKAFTSIRLTDRFEIDDEVKIFLKKDKTNVCLGIVRVVSYRIFKLDQLNDYVALLDTGYGVEECKKIIIRMNAKFNRDLSTAEFRLYLFKYVV